MKYFSIHHEAHEGHELRKNNSLSLTFVLFVPFVVTCHPFISLAASSTACKIFV